MADEYQTSNEVIGRLGENQKILLEGSVNISPTSSGVGYYGSAAVSLDDISAIVKAPTIEVYEYMQLPAPDYTNILRPCPTTIIDNATGLASMCTWVTMETSLKGSLVLYIRIWSRTDNSPHRFFYKVGAVSVTEEDVFSL